MTGRRDFVTFVAAWGAAPLSAGAQPAAKIPRVALVLSAVLLADMHGPKPADELTQTFLRRLRQLGHVEGRNIFIERRSDEGQPKRLADLMKEVVDLRVDVIVTIGQGAVEAQRATSTIPIVAYLDDPVGAGGLTASLSRPTQNVTGVTLNSGLSLIGKSLELLKKAVPRTRRVAMIDFRYVDAHASPGTHQRRVAAEAAARDLGLTLIAAGVNSVDDFEQAFAFIDSQRPDAMIAISTPVNWVSRRRIIDFAAQRRLPTIYAGREFVEEGGLMSHGPGDAGAVERLAEYVDKILKGAKPADLPFEQPSKYELVINLKTAALLGLTFPQSLLLVAEVVK